MIFSKLIEYDVITKVSINAIQIVVALVTAGFAIATSALSCRALCCADNTNQGTTLYNGQPGVYFFNILQSVV